MWLGNVDGRGAVVSFEHGVSLILQILTHQTTQIVFVFDQQNGLMAGLGWSAPRPSRAS